MTTKFNELHSSTMFAFDRSDDRVAGLLLYQALERAIANGTVDERLIDLSDVLAEWLSRRGHLSQAERLWTRSLQLKQLAFGKGDPRAMQSLEKLVWLRSGLATNRLRAEAS